MFSTEQLNLIWLKASQEPEFLNRLRSVLNAVSETPEHKAWSRDDGKTPYSLPLAMDADDAEFLEDNGLVYDNELLVKVNRLNGKLFITDGAWLNHRLRVFPDPDEARVLLDYAEKAGLTEWAGWVIDPAAGCGHTPLGFEGSKARRVSCDANARAILYARLNAKLNGVPPDHFFSVLNDMTEGFQWPLNINEPVLFLSNVPFAPSPKGQALALNSDGGHTGADLQVASFKIVRDFHKSHAVPVKACFLTWTVGSAAKNLWEVPQFCREIFAGADVKWTLVDDDYEAAGLSNPAPLPDVYRYLATSQYAVKKTESSALAEFEALAEQICASGYTDMAYGMLEVDLPAPALEKTKPTEFLRASQPLPSQSTLSRMPAEAVVQ